MALAAEKTRAIQSDRIEKFKNWCNSDDARKGYLINFNTFNNTNMAILYIDTLIKMGMYKE